MAEKANTHTHTVMVKMTLQENLTGKDYLTVSSQESSIKL